jgi:hypothetical protein
LYPTGEVWSSTSIGSVSSDGLATIGFIFRAAKIHVMDVRAIQIPTAMLAMS